MKELLRKKTFWVGLILIATGLVNGIFDGEWDRGILEILGGAAAITGRQSVAKLEAMLRDGMSQQSEAESNKRQ